MTAAARLVTKVDDDFFLVPSAIIAVETTTYGLRPSEDLRWGVKITLVTGRDLFRPASSDTRESARNLAESWRAFANTGAVDD